LPSTIHPLLQLLANLEKRQLLPRNLNLLTGFWVSTGVGPVFFNEKGTKTPDFNSFPFCQRLGYLIEKKCSFKPGTQPSPKPKPKLITKTGISLMDIFCPPS
jgi:hypothetical protein